MPIFKLNNMSYNNVKRLEHKGHIGFKRGECITVHVVNLLDDSSHYRMINGRLHVQDLNIKHHEINGQRRFIHKEKNYITIEEHNRKHFPRIKNPL